MDNCQVCGQPKDSETAYEAAADDFNEISGTYAHRKADLQSQIDELDERYERCSEHLAQHERKPGIGLFVLDYDPAQIRVS